MLCAMDRRAVVLAASCLLGCTRLNPAFDTGDTDIADASDTRAESGESLGGDGDPSTGDGDPSTGDGDPDTGDGDGDPDTGDGDGDTGDGDGEPAHCDITVRTSRRFMVDNKNNTCTLDADFYTPIVWNQVGGPWLAGMLKCGPGCDGCMGTIDFGVQNYDLLNDLLIQIGLNETNSCVHVQATDVDVLSGGICHYNSGSLAIVTGPNEVAPIFVLNRNEAELTGDAQLLLANTDPPTVGDEIRTCSCEEMWAEIKPNDVGCCEAPELMMKIPTEYLIEFDGNGFAPSVDADVFIDNEQWVIHAIQAQDVPSCGYEGLETTWALLNL